VSTSHSVSPGPQSSMGPVNSQGECLSCSFCQPRICPVTQSLSCPSTKANSLPLLCDTVSWALLSYLVYASSQWFLLYTVQYVKSYAGCHVYLANPGFYVQSTVVFPVHLGCLFLVSRPQNVLSASQLLNSILSVAGVLSLINALSSI